MKSIQRIGAIIIIGIGLSVLFSWFIYTGLEKFNTHRYTRLKEIFQNKTAYDILFIGSSRTHMTVYPHIIDSITGLSSYNAGLEGGGMREFKMALDGYLVHHPAPAIVVLNIDPGSFDLSKPLFDPPQYLPFIGKNELIRRRLQQVDIKTAASPYIPFLGMIYMDDNVKRDAIRGWFGQTELVPGQFDNKGFISNGTDCVDSSKAINVKYNEFDTAALRMLDDIVHTCQQQKVTLMLTYAPEYRFEYQARFPNFREFTTLVNNVASREQLHFFRDDSLQMNTEPCYFANYGHTNLPGAIVYSTILGERLKAWKQQQLY